MAQTRWMVAVAMLAAFAGSAAAQAPIVTITGVTETTTGQAGSVQLSVSFGGVDPGTISAVEVYGSNTTVVTDATLGKPGVHLLSSPAGPYSEPFAMTCVLLPGQAGAAHGSTLYLGVRWSGNDGGFGVDPDGPAKLPVDGDGTDDGWSPVVSAQVNCDFVDPLAGNLQAGGPPTHDTAKVSYNEPGDDGSTGNAVPLVEIIYSTSVPGPDLAQWAAGATVGLSGPGGVPGSLKTVQVGSLPAASPLYFALRATDDGGNVGISASPLLVVTAGAPPSAPDDGASDGGTCGGSASGAAGVAALLPLLAAFLRNRA